MSEVKAIKLITGEELIAQIIESDQDTLKIKNPLAIVVQRTERGPAIGFVPWMPYLEGDIVMNRSSTVLISEVDFEMRNQYNSMFGTGIITPPKELIMG